ncbi:homeobox protein CHOX-CAD-like [Haliotis rubra]|nr:homeobox protein CHOX-CAD-like [Haliotis rubra]
MALCHENSAAMFASRPSPNTYSYPSFGYPTQGGYGQEYGQYAMTDPSALQQSWMYGSAPRPAHGGMDDWGQAYTVPTTTTATLQQGPYNFSYRTHETGYPQPVVTQADSPHLTVLDNPHPQDSCSPPGTTASLSPGGGNNAKQLRAPFEWMKCSQQAPAPGKTRTKDKYRVVYSDHQRLELEKEFHYSRYITIRRKAELANQLQLSERQVKIWFQNRRAKERKQNKKKDSTDKLSPDSPSEMSGIPQQYSQVSPTMPNLPPVTSQHQLLVPSHSMYETKPEHHSPTSSVLSSHVQVPVSMAHAHSPLPVTKCENDY